MVVMVTTVSEEHEQGSDIIWKHCNICSDWDVSNAPLRHFHIERMIKVCNFPWKTIWVQDIRVDHFAAGNCGPWSPPSVNFLRKAATWYPDLFWINIQLEAVSLPGITPGTIFRSGYLIFKSLGVDRFAQGLFNWAASDSYCFRRTYRYAYTGTHRKKQVISPCTLTCSSELSTPEYRRAG